MCPPNERGSTGAAVDGVGSVTSSVTVGFLVAAAFCAAWVQRGQHVPLPCPEVCPDGARDRVAGIDPNTATVAELTTLDGVGPSMARRIVAYRSSARGSSAIGGPVFRCTEDLAAVRGIGPKTVERLRPLLTFTRKPTDGP